jgi:hypothetical protein
MKTSARRRLGNVDGVPGSSAVVPMVMATPERSGVRRFCTDVARFRASVVLWAASPSGDANPLMVRALAPTPRALSANPWSFANCPVPTPSLVWSTTTGLSKLKKIESGLLASEPGNGAGAGAGPGLGAGAAGGALGTAPGVVGGEVTGVGAIAVVAALYPMTFGEQIV